MNKMIVLIAIVTVTLSLCTGCSTGGNTAEFEMNAPGPGAASEEMIEFEDLGLDTETDAELENTSPANAEEASAATNSTTGEANSSDAGVNTAANGGNPSAAGANTAANGGNASDAGTSTVANDGSASETGTSNNNGSLPAVGNAEQPDEVLENPEDSTTWDFRGYESPLGYQIMMPASWEGITVLEQENKTSFIAVVAEEENYTGEILAIYTCREGQVEICREQLADDYRILAAISEDTGYWLVVAPKEPQYDQENVWVKEQIEILEAYRDEVIRTMVVGL